jgi:hypothetical protein
VLLVHAYGVYLFKHRKSAKHSLYASTIVYYHAPKNSKKARPPITAYRELVHPAMRMIAVAVIAIRFLV